VHKTTAAPLCVALAFVLTAGAMAEFTAFVVIFTTSLIVSCAVTASATKSGANLLGPRSTVGRPRLAMPKCGGRFSLAAEIGPL
jgi:hypothetical protein